MRLKSRGMWLLGVIGSAFVATLMTVLFLITAFAANGPTSDRTVWFMLAFSMLTLGCVFSFVSCLMARWAVGYGSRAASFASASLWLRVSGWLILSILLGAVANRFGTFLIAVSLGTPILAGIGLYLLTRQNLAAARILACIKLTLDALTVVLLLAFPGWFYAWVAGSIFGAPSGDYVLSAYNWLIVLALILLPMLSTGFNLFFTAMAFGYGPGMRLVHAPDVPSGREPLAPLRREPDPTAAIRFRESDSARFEALRPTYTAYRPAPGASPADYAARPAARSDAPSPKPSYPAPDTGRATPPPMTPAGIPNRRAPAPAARPAAPAPVAPAPAPEAAPVSLAKEATEPAVNLSKVTAEPAVDPAKEASEPPVRLTKNTPEPAPAAKETGSEAPCPAVSAEPETPAPKPDDAPYVPDVPDLDLPDFEPQPDAPLPELVNPDSLPGKDYGTAPSLETTAPAAADDLPSDPLGPAPAAPDFGDGIEADNPELPF